MIEKGSPILITEKEIFKYISQEDLCIRYIKGFEKIGKLFISEFREETNPSSRVFVGREGDLLFKDFGDAYNNKAMTIIKYIQYKYNLNYQAAINKVGIDFGLVEGSSNSSIIRKKSNKTKGEKYNPPSDLVIKIKRRDFTDRDREYWNQYNILDIVEKNNIKSISHLFINNYPPILFSERHLIFSYDYYWSNGIFRRKIYQPYSDRYKWRTNTDYTVVQNYPNIPKKGGDTLFIQSSFKDCMVMEKLGYYAIAPNKEGSWMPNTYWNKLKERWGDIIIFWDNDWEKPTNSGILMAKQYSEKYNIRYINTPNIKGITDISDFVKLFGIEAGKKLIKDLL